MRSRALSLVMCALLLGSCASSTPLDDFTAIYRHRDELVRARDFEALLAQMTPQYEIRLRNGERMGREQLRQRWTAFFTSILVRHVAFSSDIRSVARKGSEVTVTFEQKDHRIQNDPDGREREVEANVIHRDTWIHTPAGWKLRYTEEGEQTKAPRL